MEDAYLSRVIRHLIRGNYTDEEIEYANKNLQLTGDLRFIYLGFANRELEIESSSSDDYDTGAIQKQFVNSCKEVFVSLFTLRVYL